MATWVNDDDTPCYDAGIEPVSSPCGEPSFTERYRRHTARTGFDQADRKAMISDGAPWIERLTLAHHPDTTCMLDIYHVYDTSTKPVSIMTEKRSDAT